MRIRTVNLSKRFKVDWIIKNFSFEFESGKHYGISGPNGSGKTTLLHILAGLVPPSRGELLYKNAEGIIPEENWYKQLSFAAPYAEIYEYMNVRELFIHHTGFRKLYGAIDFETFVHTCYLEGHEEKLIKSYSSGMRQRLKLALGIITESEVLFLDEPQTNLDDKAKAWYFNLIDEYKRERCVVIASNEASDFRPGSIMISLNDYKK